jgi:uncharacterized protein YjiS (DUF1127 family)
MMLSLFCESFSDAVFTAFGHELNTSHVLLHRNELLHRCMRPTIISTAQVHRTCSKKEHTMLIASSIALIRRYARYRSELASISQLDERTLRDIGISRGELATCAWRYSARQQYP